MGWPLVVLFALLASSASAGDDQPRWPSIDEPLPFLGGGEADAAVVVGIDRYAFLPHVPGASANAAAWQQWLVRTRGVPAERVFTLRDAEATRERIQSRLKQAHDVVGTGGTLWVVFIGHGAPAAGGDDGVILGVDTQQDPESFAARGLAQDEVQRLISGGAQAGSVVVFDACFSGKTGDGGGVLVQGVQATVPVRQKPLSSTTTLLSASDSFAGPLPGMARPAFSYVLLGALRGWGDDDGDVSLREAFSFTARSLTSALQGDLRSPSWRGADTDLSVRAARRRLDVASIVLGSCPSSQRWNGAVCEERCTASATWNGSACVARNVACPRGMSWDGARCKPSVQCPSGTVFNAGECVAERVECPAGSTWTGQECRAQERKVTITTSAPSAVASTPTPVTASVGTPWRMLGTGAGVVGAVAALGGGAWFLQANSVIDNPDSSGVQKDSAVTGQSGGLALFAGGLVVGVAGAAAALWPTASTTEETR